MTNGLAPAAGVFRKHPGSASKVTDRAGMDRLGLRQFATHHLPLAEAPQGYGMFRNKTDGCIKVVLQP